MASAVKKIPVENLWAKNEDGESRPVRAIMGEHLEPGLYEFIYRKSDLMGDLMSLKPMNVVTDTLLVLPGSLMEYIVGAAESFWKRGDAYKLMGLVHKRGLMIEGTPGSGKTVSCLMAGQEIGKRGGVAIFVAPSTNIQGLPAFLETLREFEPTMPLMIIFEDIDKHLPPITPQSSGSSDQMSILNMNLLLSLLDGEKQIQNVIYIATTNFLDKIDARLTNRPSRFDEIIKAKAPNKIARKAYFEKIVPDAFNDKLDSLVQNSKGLNFAHMKELAICTCIYDRDVEKTSERLRNLNGNHGTGFADSEED